jgi:hypothetical protein
MRQTGFIMRAMAIKAENCNEELTMVLVVRQDGEKAKVTNAEKLEDIKGLNGKAKEASIFCLNYEESFQVEDGVILKYQGGKIVCPATNKNCARWDIDA